MKQCYSESAEGKYESMGCAPQGYGENVMMVHWKEGVGALVSPVVLHQTCLVHGQGKNPVFEWVLSLIRDTQFPLQ